MAILTTETINTFYDDAQNTSLLPDMQISHDDAFLASTDLKELKDREELQEELKELEELDLSDGALDAVVEINEELEDLQVQDPIITTELDTDDSLQMYLHEIIQVPLLQAGIKASCAPD